MFFLSRGYYCLKGAKFRNRCTSDRNIAIHDAHSQKGWSLPGQSTAFLIIFTAQCEYQSIITSARWAYYHFSRIYVWLDCTASSSCDLNVWLYLFWMLLPYFPYPSTYNMTEKASLCSENEWSDPERKSRKINLPHSFHSLSPLCLALT